MISTIIYVHLYIDYPQNIPIILVFQKIDYDYDSGVGKCPILGIIIGHHLIVAIIDHIPNGWVMFNGDI